MALLRLATVVTALALVAGHGHMTLPASTRNGGSLRYMSHFMCVCAGCLANIYEFLGHAWF